MTNRLAPFLTAELSALLFSLDIAATVEPLVSEASQIQQELIDELKERGAMHVMTAQAENVVPIAQAS